MRITERRQEQDKQRLTGLLANLNSSSGGGLNIMSDGGADEPNTSALSIASRLRDVVTGKFSFEDEGIWRVWFKRGRE